MNTQTSREQVASDLKRFYQTSTRYRDDLQAHDERFLEPYLILIERYVQPPARVLDVGCGTALSTRLLMQRGFETLGVDLSPLFLSVEKETHPTTQLAAADATQLPFEDESFDVVAAFEFIEHAPDVPALLDELKRILKPRGYLFFHSPNLISPYLPAYDIARMMLGGEGRPVFAETLPQAWKWLGGNLALSLKKWLLPQTGFTYRDPDLSERRIGGDSDSVYLANPIDLASYLGRNGFIIDQRAHAMSLKNKSIAAITPNFAPYMGLVAHKRSRP